MTRDIYDICDRYISIFDEEDGTLTIVAEATSEHASAPQVIARYPLMDALQDAIDQGVAARCVLLALVSDLIADEEPSEELLAAYRKYKNDHHSAGLKAAELVIASQRRGCEPTIPDITGGLVDPA